MILNKLLTFLVSVYSVQSSFVAVNISGYTWDNANFYCLQTYQTTLATIKSSTDESDVIAAAEAANIYNTNKDQFWIGLNDKLSTTNWVWAEDGSDTSLYLNWNNGEPNNEGVEHCGEIRKKDNGWNNHRCNGTNVNGFVCNYYDYIGVSYSDISFNDANLYCLENYGSTLATISSSYDQENVINAAKAAGIYKDSNNYRVWIGFTNLLSSDNYEWVDGSAVTYTNWYNGEPNNVNDREHCGEIRSKYGGQWNDEGCDRYTADGFVCNPIGSNSYSFENGQSIDTNSQSYKNKKILIKDNNNIFHLNFSNIIIYCMVLTCFSYILYVLYYKVCTNNENYQKIPNNNQMDTLI